jgi:hypothetical protein
LGEANRNRGGEFSRVDAVARFTRSAVIDSARELNGTTWAFPFFERAAGIVHVAFLASSSRSNSLISAPASSVTRTLVSMTSRSLCPMRFEFGGSPVRRQNSPSSSSDSTCKACTRFAWMGDPFATMPSQSATRPFVRFHRRAVCANAGGCAGSNCSGPPPRSACVGGRPRPRSGRPRLGRFDLAASSRSLRSFSTGLTPPATFRLSPSARSRAWLDANSR